MSDRAQYGELMRAAGSQILSANLLLEAQSMQSEAAARSAVIAYQDLLHALASHGRQLFGGAHNMWAVRAARDPQGGLAVSWSDGARAVRAATDLLATLHDAEGGWRSPEAALLADPSVRAAGFGELASVTIPVTLAATGLERRVEEAGVRAELVPDTRNARHVALQVRDLAHLGGFGRSLSTLEVAKPTIQTQDPYQELTDRVARLHRVAWQLTREDWVGLCSLADLAVAGIVVHETAAGQMRQMAAASDGPVDLGVRRALVRYDEGASAWREVHVQLAQLRTTTPVLDGLRGDVVAVRRLLEMFAEGEPTPRAQRVVVAAAGRFGEIAVWNREVFEAQAKNGRVYIPGRFLSGNQVSDDPLLVRAKLQGLLAPLQKEQVKALTSAYKRAIEVASPPPSQDRSTSQDMGVVHGLSV